MNLRSLTGAVALALSPLAVHADGLPAEPSSGVPVAHCCQYVPGPDWTGLYVGASAGGAWRDTTWTFPATAGTFNTAAGQNFSVPANALIGGVHVGANYQFSRIVVGGEISYSAAELIGTIAGPIPANPNDRFKVSGTDLFTATGRLGVAVDKFLFYGRGGFATTYMQVDAQSATGVTARVGRHEAGWIAGGGLETRLFSDVLFGVEYNYISFSGNQYNGLTSATPPTPFIVTLSDLNTQVVTARLSILFGPNACCHNGLLGKY